MFPLTLQADGRRVIGALEFSAMTQEREWVPAIRERLRLVAGVISQALARKGSQTALDEALQEIRHLHERIADGRERGPDEAIETRRDVKTLRSSRPVVSESQTIKRALAQVEQVAPTPATVLLLGETGAGKEVFAQAIHDLSPRHNRHMVRVSCAAIPPALIESELFGRERGAYTGALSRQIGRFEAANQSTLFLDEIGELPLEVQVKLLRVLQERVIERLGSTQPIKIDVRIIAATNRNLEQAVTTARSARICSTASTCSRSSCRRCASARRTSRASCGRSSTSSRRSSASGSSRSRRTACATCSATPGRATSASCATSSSAR